MKKIVGLLIFLLLSPSLIYSYPDFSKGLKEPVVESDTVTVENSNQKAGEDKQKQQASEEKNSKQTAGEDNQKQANEGKNSKQAGDNKQDEPEQFKITNGPYLCDMGYDGVTIVWKTNGPALSWVEFDEDGTDHFYAKPRKIVYDAKYGKIRTSDSVHTVRLNNLESGKKYRYRVCSKQVLKEKGLYQQTLYGSVASTDVFRKAPLRFRTFSPDDKEINFLVLNDIHERSALLKQLVRKVDVKELDFVVLNGDMVNWVEDESTLMNGFINACVSTFASEVPIVFCRGNHETRGRYSEYLYKYFPTRSGEFYYDFNIGPVKFIVLDGGEDKPDSDIEYSGSVDYDNYRIAQAGWLKSMIARNDSASVKVVFLHIPPVGGDWHGALHIEELFVPLLNELGTDIVFSGHTHKYQFMDKDGATRFPVYVNGNDTALFCRIRKGKLEVKRIGWSVPVTKDIPVDF